VDRLKATLKENIEIRFQAIGLGTPVAADEFSPVGIGSSIKKRIDFAKTPAGPANPFAAGDFANRPAGPFAPKWITEQAEKDAARKTAAEKMAQDQAEKDAFRFTSSFIDKGIADFRKTWMQFPAQLPAMKEPEARNEVRTLEQGTSEAFQVMRSMVGPQKDKDDVQKKQLATQEKQLKKLDEIAKKVGNSSMEMMKVGEID
jgi:hypothetical protein